MASASTTSLIALRQKYLDALEAEALKVSNSVDGESYQHNEWRKGLLDAVAAIDKQLAGRQPFSKRLNQRAV